MTKAKTIQEHYEQCAESERLKLVDWEIQDKAKAIAKANAKQAIKNPKVVHNVLEFATIATTEKTKANK